MSWLGRWRRAIGDPRLLVVGGASLDRLHVGAEIISTPGGAGLYTALAATRAGATVTMLAPRPHPMPPELAPVDELIRWVGPEVDIDGLPRFEIGYDESGSVSLFREHLGAEPTMTPSLLDDLGELPPAAYCVPFLDARLQREFITALGDRGCLTIASTYGRAARTETETVRGTMAIADMSFCNADEAEILYGADARARPGQFRFVTRGAAGVVVYQGDHATSVPAERVDVVDPTGAGDTFCGTAVARVLRGDHPVEAARRATAASAQVVAAVGPAMLSRSGPAPEPASDPRVGVVAEAVHALAALIADRRELHAFDFTGAMFPPVGEPATLEWFAAATLQQFGFWYERNGRWDAPMIAMIDGISRKGSDYLWTMFERARRVDPRLIAPDSQASLTLEGWSRLAADDSGADPFPDPTARVELARAYGATMAALELDVADLVSAAASSARPMGLLLALLDHVGGYREDPLRKKSALFGIIARQRPEGFLPDLDDDDAPAIVDYHVQRSCLRTGMVEIHDPDLTAKIVSRTVLTEDEEWAVRRPCADAVAQLRHATGRTMGEVDWFLFQMRHRCPETTTPDCASCPADPVCGHRWELFQPVRRTTFY